MSHVLTVKIPHPVLNRLEEVCASEGKTKGALVREALEAFLKGKKEVEGHLAKFRSATEAMFRGKKVKARVDWEKIYREARVPMDITPEEEVRRGRMRGLDIK